MYLYCHAVKIHVVKILQPQIWAKVLKSRCPMDLYYMDLYCMALHSDF